MYIKYAVKRLNHVDRATLWHIQILIFLVLLVALPIDAKSPGKMLTEKEVIHLGMQRPEILQQMRSHKEIAESELIGARTWKNPEFSYERESVSDGQTDSEQNYWISQEFSMPGKRTNKKKAALLRLDAAGKDVAQWRLDRAAKIREVFYQVLYVQRLQQIYSKWRSEMDSLEGVMRKRKEAGDISAYDLGRLKQEKSLLLAQLQKIQAEYTRLLQVLLAEIGMLEVDIPVQGLSGELFPEVPLPPLEILIEQMNKHPDLTAIQLRAQSYAADERFAERSWLPDPTIGLGYKQVEGGDGDALLFGVSIPMPVLDRNVDSRIRAKANRQRLQSQYAQVFSDRKGRIKGLWHQGKELRNAVNLLEAKGDASVLKIAEVAYNAGEIGVLEILDAYRSAFEHQMQLADLMRETRMVRIKLEMYTGGNIE